MNAWRNSPEKQALEREKQESLRQLTEWLELPMVVLGFAWLVLLVIELIWGLGPVLQGIGTLIWIVFVLEFLVKLILAPRKVSYLRSQWLAVVSLLVPALRVFRAVRFLQVLRAARATRGLRLLRLISSLNRGMGALRASMGRRGFGYVAALTLVVTLVGAAGMYAFENNNADGRGLKNYGTALWWTAMVMTTMGSEYWPQTPEGRVLCLVLATYAFAMFGYVTATLATFFVGRDAESKGAEVAGAKSIEALRAEIQALRSDLQAQIHTPPDSTAKDVK